MSNTSFIPSGWADYIIPASFNGVPFFVKSVKTQKTRKQNIKTFFDSDITYVEDTGRGPQTIEFDAFFTGLGLYELRLALDAVTNNPGPGLLVHPTYGPITASLNSLSYTEETGNLIDATMQFVVTQNYTYAQLNQLVSINTQNSVLTNALNLQGTLAGNFLNTGGNLISGAESGISTLTNVIGNFGSKILSAAQSSITSISTLVGVAGVAIIGYEFGRYALGNSTPQTQIPGISGLNNQTDILAAAQTQAQIQAATNQAAIITNIDSINSDAANNSSTLPADLATAVTSLQNSIADPALAISSLINFCSFTSNIQQTTVLSQIEQATAALCRRAALSALASACAAYQPTSTTNAYAVINAVRPVFNAEITSTANGQAVNDSTYQALKALSQSVIADLQARSTNLPSLIQKTYNVSLPSVVIANLLYGDATRQDQLVSLNNTVACPLFMPSQVFCLSS